MTVLGRLIAAILAVVLIGLPLHRAQADVYTGAGSTFVQPILAKWAKSIAGQDGDGGAMVSMNDGLDYEPVGSLGGVMRVIQRDVDFGATDVPLPPEDLAKRSLDQFPIVTGGVAVVVNLRGVASGALKLSGPALARIYLGEINRWSDPLLAALNPGLTLPDAPIEVFRRGDGSGTTYHFASYLASVSEDWKTRVGVDTLLVWPVGKPAKGNRELADKVRETANAIGYVEASQAVRLNLAMALVGNKAGNFVSPTPGSLQAALATTVWDPAKHFYSEIVAPGGADAYPITATVFVLMPRPLGQSGHARRTIEFFRLALTERSADAAELGYVPLPPSVVRQVIEYWQGGASRVGQ